MAFSPGRRQRVAQRCTSLLGKSETKGFHQLWSIFDRNQWDKQKKLEKQENHGTSWSLEMLKMFQVGNIEDLGELTNRNCN
jgi:hypothetical protein